MEGIKNLIEITLFIISKINPIYYLIKQFNIIQNLDEVFINLISTGGFFAIMFILALIYKAKCAIKR